MFSPLCHLLGLLAFLFLSGTVLAQTYEEGRQAYIEGNYRDAFKILQPLALEGDSEAQKMLGIMYDYGHGVKANSEKALEWYLRSAEQGQPAVQYQVGAKYFRGDGVKQNYSEAARWWEMAANGGQVDAQFNLGLMFFRGLAIESDDVRAAGLFAQAADQGHGHSQYSLAVMYAFGRGVEKNYATALKWFEKAAEQDIGQAQFNLGVFYENGYGVDQDLAAASSWYEKAADQGVEEAEKKLAQMTSADYSPPQVSSDESTDVEPFVEQAAEIEEPQEVVELASAAGEVAQAEEEMIDSTPLVDGIRGREWALAQDPGHYTMQIGSVTREEDIVNFLKENNIDNDAAYIEVEIKDVTRYNALYGVYENYEDATNSIEDLPGSLQKVKPWVRSFRMIHKLLGREDES